MEGSKYQIGDCIPGSKLIVRGVMYLSDGSCRYFLQVGLSDNSQVVHEVDLEPSHSEPCPCCNQEFCSYIF